MSQETIEKERVKLISPQRLQPGNTYTLGRYTEGVSEWSPKEAFTIEVDQTCENVTVKSASTFFCVVRIHKHDGSVNFHLLVRSDIHIPNASLAEHLREYISSEIRILLEDVSILELIIVNDSYCVRNSAIATDIIFDRANDPSFLTVRNDASSVL